MFKNHILQNEGVVKYIVTGTGRCGTNFLAKLLTSAGVPCGRETIFNMTLRKPGRLEADSSWMALPYLEKNPEIWNKCRIVHLVRNPWDVMRGWLFDFESVFSVWRTGQPYRPTNHFLVTHTPGLKEIESPLDRVLFFYINWNERIQALSRYKFDYDVVLVNAESSASSILWKVGIDPTDKELFSNRQENTRRKCVLTREDVDNLLKPRPLYGRLIEKAKEYRYECP